MKTIALTVLAVLLLGFAQESRAAESLNETLQKALFEEEANHNLEAAIKAYQSVLEQTDEQRKLAATAVFRLGECYRKLGKTNEASAQYQRVIRDFGEQTALVDFSRQSLTALGAPSAIAAKSGDLAAATDEEEKEVQRIKSLIKDSPDLINSPGEAGQTPLHKAAQAGQLVVARFLLANKADVNAHVKDGAATPLHFAAQAGHKSMVEFLLAHGATANASGAFKKGGTALHLAAGYGYRSVAEVLIANKADVNARDFAGLTPLHLAVEGGHKPVAELLLANGAEINANRTSSGWTPLHIAAKEGHQSLVDLLLSQKADVNAKDTAGMSPLSWAVENGKSSIAQLLLENGADANSLGRSGLPLLHVAISRNSPETVQLLLAHKPDVEIHNDDGYTPLQAAVRNNPRLEIIQLLLAAGADVNSPFKPAGPPKRYGSEKLSSEAGAPFITDHTPLLVAALKKEVQVVKELLAKGADVNATSPDGATALHYAVSGGSLPLVQAILAQHPDTEIRTKYRNTPIFNAVAQDTSIMEAVIKAGAEVNVRGYEGKTPLHNAVERRSLPMVKTILAYHPDTEIRDDAGYTALRVAQFDDTKIIEALLRAGTDPNSVRSDGNSMLHYAVRERRNDIVELLVTNKADVNLINKEGETPLVWTQQKEASMPGRLLPILPAGIKAQHSEPASLEEIATYLLRHGADENIPRRSFINVSRKERKANKTVFFKGTNSLNHYTLFEAIAAAYPNRYNPNEPTFPFPDFANVSIKRISTNPGSNVLISVDFAKIFDAGECGSDLPLQWGDVVEIPELDHGVNQSWPGLSPAILALLNKCLKREVEISVKNERSKVTLVPDVPPTSPVGGAFQTSWKSIVSFRLKDVINRANVLRLSSDLSRVKVKRPDAKTGQSQELLFNLSDGAPYDGRTDLWLRDGDIIEVPEK